MRAGVIALTKRPVAIAVSCVSPDGSSGQVAANLGVSLVQAGFRVAVVEADPFDRTAEHLVSANDSPGLSDYLQGRHDLDACLQVVHGLDFIAAGTDPESARELYAGPRLAALIKDLRAKADFVVVGAAATSSADADAIALACDGVLIVVTDGLTTHADTAATLDRFQRLGVPAFGAVTVPVSKLSRRPGTAEQPASAGASESDRRADPSARNLSSPLIGTDA